MRDVTARGHFFPPRYGLNVRHRDSSPPPVIVSGPLRGHLPPRRKVDVTNAHSNFSPNSFSFRPNKNTHWFSLCVICFKRSETAEFRPKKGEAALHDARAINRTDVITRQQVATPHCSVVQWELNVTRGASLYGLFTRVFTSDHVLTNEQLWVVCVDGSFRLSPILQPFSMKCRNFTTAVQARLHV